ncbi:hypothetical protein LIPSTDRAFT_242414 [Lipomyces starkeyi NRRL Y-11557]|uniref:CCHC-type domain-containing protein n=1 Tax=Lipomyces starkeyi NRRL Y-11557 TaxID=675824 RepID=A0A1E3QC47_LIPST|nr:hypothetical protein LIPSTDRAFT_242414 [Lipomyces starkeyi NRRL Y-11557]
MMHSSVLLQAEVQALQTANKAANRRHQRRRKRLQHGGILTVQEGLDLIQRIEVDKQIQHETGKNDQIRENETKQRRCGNCGETGHNSRTCKKN